MYLRLGHGLGSVDFERRKRDVRLAACLPPDERIVGVEAGRVKHVGVVAAGGAH